MGLKGLLTQTSDRRHWHCKLIVAVTKTAASKVSLRLRLYLRALRWARVTGEHLGWQAARGACEPAPCVAHFKWSVLCQGAPLTVCHSSRPKSHVLSEPLDMEPAPLVVIKCDSSHSGAGILSASL